MKFCSKCGKELMDEAVVCPGCGCPVVDITQQNQPAAAVDDDVHIGLCIISAIFPIFGLIYWAVKYKDKPKRAKACGFTACFVWSFLSLIYALWPGLF